MLSKSNPHSRIGWRISCFEFPDRLVIKIRTPANTYLVAILPIILLGWGYVTFGMLMADFNISVACFSICGMLFPLYAFLWGIAGKEIITISTDKIMIKQDVFGMGFRQTYQFSRITNMRSSITNPTLFTLEKNMQEWGIAGGSVAFDCNGRLIRFGLQLQKKDADELVVRIKQYISIPD